MARQSPATCRQLWTRLSRLDLSRTKGLILVHSSPTKQHRTTWWVASVSAIYISIRLWCLALLRGNRPHPLWVLLYEQPVVGACTGPCPGGGGHVCGALSGEGGCLLRHVGGGACLLGYACRAKCVCRAMSARPYMSVGPYISVRPCLLGHTFF